MTWSAQQAYESLAKPIQRVLYDMRWTSLRPIQVEAISVLLRSESDLILSARTAAGKTEAAFLPILSKICTEPASSVQALYVGPLRALINDQFRRLEDLCKRTQIPVFRWHGDVPASRKAALIKRPAGVLLITPESIESLFLNRTEYLPRVFGGLTHVVIDELHAMHGQERGVHLRSLLSRLEVFPAHRPVHVALSATIGDIGITKSWLRPDTPEAVKVVSSPGQDTEVRLSVTAYVRSCEEQHNEPMEDETRQKNLELSPPGLSDDLYRWTSRGKHLVFANSRAAVEWYTDEMRQRSEADGFSGRYLVHHGSVSREVREHTEKQMQQEGSRTTFCTSTLELGLDIGDVDSVGQIGCPFSVGSLTQRLGRSGRKEGQPQIMRLAMIEDQPAADADLEDRIYPQLLRVTALVDLMLEGWTEPPDPEAGDLSTFVQQVLSVIRQTGGVPAQELFIRLASQGAFRWVTSDLYKTLLRSIATHDLIEQHEGRNLILGLAGERIVANYNFYSAFVAGDEYRVSHKGQMIGVLSAKWLPLINQHMLLAGRRWVVTDIDHDRREVFVKPSAGRRLPRFGGSEGNVHRTVHERMRDILYSNNIPRFLDSTCRSLITEARRTAEDSIGDEGIVEGCDSRGLYWFPWAGTRGLRTLAIALTRFHSNVNMADLAVRINTTRAGLVESLKEIVASPPSVETLSELAEPGHRRKYDHFLSDELLRYSFGTDLLSLEDALTAARRTISVSR